MAKKKIAKSDIASKSRTKSIAKPLAKSGVSTTQGGNKNNSYTILSLVFGLLFFIPLAPILAIIFGFIGLHQIKETGEDGRGMAIAGIILGFFWILIFVILLIVVLSYVSSLMYAASAAGGAVPLQ